MPRIKAKKSEYMAKDFSAWLVGQMWLRGKTQEDVAKWIHCERSYVSKKLKNHSFKLEEILIIFHELEVTPEEMSKLLLY